MQFFADATFDVDGDVDSLIDMWFVFRHIEEGLVDGDGLYQISIVGEDLSYLFRHFPVHLHAAGEDDKLRTDILSDNGRKRRMNAVLACHIVGCGYHPAFVGMSYGHRHIVQLGLVALFDGGEESIHINMNNLSQHGQPFPDVLFDLFQFCVETLYGQSHDIVIASFDVAHGDEAYPFLYAIGTGFVERQVTVDVIVYLLIVER